MRFRDRHLVTVFILLFKSQTIISTSALPLAENDEGGLLRLQDKAALTANNNALRGHYPHHHHPLVVAVERIIDKDALQDLAEDGEDPTDKEYVFHPPGHEANVEEYPFFGHWSLAMCGATIIHDDIILTAGHCGRKATEPHWRKSVRFLNKYRESGGITRRIAHLQVHPQYRGLESGQVYYDFQLVKLQSSVLVDGEKEPTGAKLVKLNTNPHNPSPGDVVSAVGFGTVTPDGHTGNSQVLMDVTLQAFSNQHCVNQYGFNDYSLAVDGDIMVCVGSLDGSRDTCKGDSGGPILDAKDRQIGVISWGKGCAEANYAGIASRVSAVTGWIQEQICRLSAMPPASCGTNTTISYNNRLPSGSEDDKGDFAIRVTVQHDSAPEETSWSLTHQDSWTLLYWQPFESVPVAFVDVSHVFHDLIAGTYVFSISDSKKDGICCQYGRGSIVITNHHTNQVLWQHSGEFDEFLGATLELDSDGSVVSLEETNIWISPSERTNEANSKESGNSEKSG